MHIQNESLIKACRQQNQLAQMQVYDLYAQSMFKVALRYLKNDEDAKDIMQEGFLKAFQKIDQYKPDASFGAWLKRIIINQCFDTLKKKQLQFNDVDVETLKIIDSNWEFDVCISKENILEAIENLSDKHKLVVKLYLIEGYDHEEIAEILEIPAETSRTHLHRGKLKLKELLKSKYDEARY
jgi:RNA polymerase sigma-70 factor (ECF subfamily)